MSTGGGKNPSIPTSSSQGGGRVLGEIGDTKPLAGAKRKDRTPSPKKGEDEGDKKAKTS